MTITLYVNWSFQEIYRTDEELINGYIEYACEEEDFRRWLDENYTSDEIFAFTEHEKEEAKMSYQEELLKSARYWAYDNNMTQEINIQGIFPYIPILDVKRLNFLVDNSSGL